MYIYIMYIYNVYSLNGMEINPSRSSYVDISSVNSNGTTLQGPERQALRFVMGLNFEGGCISAICWITLSRGFIAKQVCIFWVFMFRTSVCNKINPYVSMLQFYWISTFWKKPLLWPASRLTQATELLDSVEVPFSRVHGEIAMPHGDYKMFSRRSST
jgi:hypothetical protein